MPLPDREQRMPDVKWEWRVGPHTVIAIVQLVVIAVAVLGGFLKMQSDLENQRDTITQLRSLVASVQNAQSAQADRVTRVETKVDMMLPMLQRIDSNLTGGK